jgi:hypothetical protein
MSEQTTIPVSAAHPTTPTNLLHRQLFLDMILLPLKRTIDRTISVPGIGEHCLAICCAPAIRDLPLVWYWYVGVWNLADDFHVPVFYRHGRISNTPQAGAR